MVSETLEVTDQLISLSDLVDSAKVEPTTVSPSLNTTFTATSLIGATVS